MRPAIAKPSVRAQFRLWPRSETTCHLALLDVQMIPTVSDVDAWVSEVAGGEHDLDGRAFSAIRTGALFPQAAEAFLDHGFVEIDRLALLDRPLLERSGQRPPVPHGTTAVRLRDRHLPNAATIDAGSFDATWSNDAASLDEISHATPQSRRRMVIDTRRAARTPWMSQADWSALGFSITGRAGNVGYLQRLAVSPSSRRRGVGRYLVDDACRWLTQRGANKVLVNTGVNNSAALALYDSCGFRVSSSELVVLELAVDSTR